MATRKASPPGKERPLTAAQRRKLLQQLKHLEQAHRAMHLQLRAVRRQIEGPFMFMG